MRQAFERRKNLIVKLAKEIPGLEVNNPEGAFYLFPKCSSYFGKKDGERVINNSTDFAMYLLEVGHVATVGGDCLLYTSTKIYVNPKMVLKYQSVTLSLILNTIKSKIGLG